MTRQALETRCDSKENVIHTCHVRKGSRLFCALLRAKERQNLDSNMFMSQKLVGELYSIR